MDINYKLQITRDNKLRRRNVLKGTSSAALGFGAISMTGSAAANGDSNGSGVSNGLEKFETGDFEAENYIETEDYVYRRVQTDETDKLLRFDIESGQVKFAEIKLESDSGERAETSGEGSLKEQTQQQTGFDKPSPSSTSSNIKIDAVEPAEIVETTPGITVQNQGVIFEEVAVEHEQFADCDAFIGGTNSHHYYHVAMRLQDYDFDDLGDVVGFAVVCDALFLLIGKKLKVLKKLLQKIQDSPLIGVIPGSICGFIFGDLLDGIFNNGDGTFALWDKEGGWLNEPKIAFGGSSEFDPNPADVRNSGSIEEAPGVHTGTFV